MKKPIVIYHGNCADGFAAAWCFWRVYGDAMEYYPGVYSEPPPDVYDRDVYMVDFSYKRNTMIHMASIVNKFFLIDHHKSALEDLWDVNGLDMSWCSINNSGAVLAWKFVQKLEGRREKMPRIVEHIQDRDLWKFEMPHTREIQSYLFAHEYDFDVWNKMITATKAGINRMIAPGAIVDKKHMKDINELLKICKRDMRIAGHTVPTASMPYTMGSDAGSLMALDAPFAATYYDTKDHRCFSLRANKLNPNAVDVSEIAVLYGGGGHQYASGFKVPRTHALAAA